LIEYLVSKSAVVEHLGNRVSPKKSFTDFFSFGTVFGFTTKNQRYVSSVVLYCADYTNLLPVVPYENNG